MGEHIVPVTSPVTLITACKARRTIAVNALKRLAKLNPTEIRPIVMAIIVNPVESAEVRIAAVSVLPFAQPTTAELQGLAVRTWMEPSEQVSAFIVSTLRSLAYTKVEELKTVGLKARSVLYLIKSEQYGIQYSHNINYSSFVEYLRVLANDQYQLVHAKDSLIPHKLSLKTVYYGPSNTYKIPAIEFSAYTYGMDFLLEKYLHFFTTEEKTTSPIREQLNKITEELKLKTREISAPFSFIYGSMAGIESSLYLDSEIVVDVIEQLTTKFEAGHEMEFNHVGAHQVFDASFMFVTEAGFPILATTMPIIYSVKGSVVVAPREGKVLGKVVPVINDKIQTHFGIISPFTKEMIGAGVEMSVHSSLPVEIEGKMIKGEVELAVRIPTEIVRPGLLIKPVHAFVLPYTFKHNLLTVTPFSKSTHLRKIVSGLVRQPISIEVGQPLGLSARVHYHSDAKFVALVSYIQKITQHTPLSILPSAILPSTVRMSSVSVELLPAESVTKEFKLIISLSTKGMMHSLSKKMITEAEIPSEFTQVKSVLSQLEKANVVEIIAMTKGASGSALKKIKSAIVIGKKLSGPSSLPLYMGAAEITPILGETFGLRFEGQIELPKLMNRWNIEKIVNEPLKADLQGKLFFGKSTEMESIKIFVELDKTLELIREIRASPEFKKCMVEVGRQGVLSPVCSIVRHQAAALDKIHVTIEAPKAWSRSSILSFLDGVFQTLLIGNIETEQVISGTEGTLIVEARADRTSQVVTFGKVITPTRNIVMKNLRLLGYPRFILPATVLRTPIEVAALKLTTNSIPSTCRVEPSFVRTFDNVPGW